MKPDRKFCNCLRQSWKKIVGTLAPICYFAHRGQITEPTSLCHHSMESLSLPLHPNLPHPPSINVGEIGETADDMTSINIGPGEGGSVLRKSAQVCQHFFPGLSERNAKKIICFWFFSRNFFSFQDNSTKLHMKYDWNMFFRLKEEILTTISYLGNGHIIST